MHTAWPRRTAIALTLLAAPCALIRGSAAVRERDAAAEVAPGTFVDADGLRVHVQTWGPDDGPTALLVPGTSAWAETWVEVAEPLAARGVRVVAMDLPPFGYTERPADDRYDREAQAARILGVARTLGRPLALVGHSFGGGATVQAAMTSPETFDAVVLLSPALALAQPPAAWAPVARIGPVAEVGVAATFANPWFLPTGVRAMVADPEVATPIRVDRYAQPLSVAGTTRAIARWLPELGAPAPSRAGDPEAYRTLDLTVRLVWGAEDHVTPVAQGEALAALLPRAELTVLTGVGHLPQIEDPEAVVAAIAETAGR